LTPTTPPPPILFWFRRDLRIKDNAGLYRALTHPSGAPVYCVFVFDRDILDALPSKEDRRVEFLHGCVSQLQASLRQAGGELFVFHDSALKTIPQLAQSLSVSQVFTNEDYEPLAIERDRQIDRKLAALGIGFQSFKDQVLHAKSEVLTQAGQPFTVFTPYKNACLKKLGPQSLQPFPSEKHLKHLAPVKTASALPSLQALGFAPTNLQALKIEAGESGAETLIEKFTTPIDHYHEARDFPAKRGVSYLSVHNRFGTVSIRRLALWAFERDTAGAKIWLNELLWRDFYFQILYHFPHAAQSAFKPKYTLLAYENDKGLFQAWCDAKTGYPIVDAAMRQINQTGFMHNRLRMIVASFLTKDLLIDWRWGERYFAQHLNDFDLAANNGGWQWAASTGCDAQPYFRIFNPVTQSERFDPQGHFIRRYLPELNAVPDAHIHAPWLMSIESQKKSQCTIGQHYPAPVVDHANARLKALALYKTV
jgi:deoxyribodipyrimidine photo-lyase